MAMGAPPPSPVVLPSSGILNNPPALSYGFSVEAAFVGNHGVSILVDRNINASLVPGSGSRGQPLNILFGRTADTTLSVPIHTYFDSLQAKLNRKLSNGF